MTPCSYFDTSALLKIYHREFGTDYVEEIYNNAEALIFISELSKVEYYSALHKKLREGEIAEDALEIALRKFRTDCTRRFNVENLTSAILSRAAMVIETYGRQRSLRTLDAIQPASFMLIADEETVFVCSDRRLNDVVIAEGYVAIAPPNHDNPPKSAGF